MTGLTAVTFDGFVRADGGSLVDGRGQAIVMRGVGLGNWLLPEGYMWRFPREGPQSARQIEALIVDLAGEAAAAAFWRTFRERFIAEADIERIAAEGFDHVRLPMSARLLLDDAGELRPDGLAPIDRLIGWCRRHGLWVILDLHGAPGGQTGTNIDDSPRGLPDLFLVGGAYRERTIGLWTRLAARYRDEPVIAGYDLLNEPLPHAYGDRYAGELATLYRDLTAAIRAVDPNHLLTYEGTHWSTDWSIFREAWDPNSLLQFHRYWSPPDRPSIAEYLEIGQALSLPIYMGEGGENDPDWLATAFGLYEDVGISWNLWPWKKLRTWTSPASVVPPDGWEAVVAYAARQGPRPSPARAREILGELLERMLLAACEMRADVINAPFHRVPVRLPPEAFGFRGDGRSYGTRNARPLDGFRSDDRVTIRRANGAPGEAAWDHDDVPDRPAPRFEVVLDAGDWVEYAIHVPMPSRLDVAVGVRLADPERQADQGAAPTVWVDGEALAAVLDADCLRGTTGGVVGPGRRAVRIEGRRVETVIRWVDVIPSP